MARLEVYTDGTLVRDERYESVDDACFDAIEWFHEGRSAYVYNNNILLFIYE